MNALSTNASLINSKQVENVSTKTLRDFFLKFLKLLLLKSFQLKVNAQIHTYYRKCRKLHETYRKGLGLRKITTKISRKPQTFSNPKLKYVVED